MLTAKEVEKRLTEIEGEGSLEIFDELHGNNKNIPQVDGWPEIKYVASYGGEGQGDEYWVVFSVGNQFFKLGGFYDSWNGNEWTGDLVEVFPKIVASTEYVSENPKKPGIHSAAEVWAALDKVLQKMEPDGDGEDQFEDARYEFWEGSVSYKDGKILYWNLPKEERGKIDLGELGVLEYMRTVPNDPGDGKYWGSLWKLGEQYFIKDGFYSSWDSSEFDGDFHEVRKGDRVAESWHDIFTGEEVDG